MTKILSFGLALLSTIACKPRSFNPNSQIKANLRNDEIPGEVYPQPADAITLEQYLKECTTELGPLPQEIDCKESPAVSASDPETKEYVTRSGAKEKYLACFNPTLALSVTAGCDGTTIYHREKNKIGSEFVTICRRSPPDRDGNTRINVGASIGYNPKTGATCFFKFKKQTPFQESGLLPGVSLPMDGSNRDPRRNWETPGFITNMGQGTCVNCHSAYPWIRGPHTMQEGEPLDKLVPFNHYAEDSTSKDTGNSESNKS